MLTYLQRLPADLQESEIDVQQTSPNLQADVQWKEHRSGHLPWAECQRGILWWPRGLWAGLEGRKWWLLQVTAVRRHSWGVSGWRHISCPMLPWLVCSGAASTHLLQRDVSKTAAPPEAAQGHQGHHWRHLQTKQFCIYWAWPLPDRGHQKQVYFKVADSYVLAQAPASTLHKQETKFFRSRIFCLGVHTHMVTSQLSCPWGIQVPSCLKFLVCLLDIHH